VVKAELERGIQAQTVTVFLRRRQFKTGSLVKKKKISFLHTFDIQ
jgi:hypothetical protein